MGKGGESPLIRTVTSTREMAQGEEYILLSEPARLVLPSQVKTGEDLTHRSWQLVFSRRLPKSVKSVNLK